MNFELIGWFVVYLILSETIFIFSIRGGLINSSDWIGGKVMAFLTGAFLMFIQFIIIIGFGEGWNPNYYILIYELLIIGGIILLFIINKWIVEKLE